jgi:hypothetical protein
MLKSGKHVLSHQVLPTPYIGAKDFRTRVMHVHPLESFGVGNRFVYVHSEPRA